MYKRVDTDEAEETLEGFSYKDKDGDMVTVHLDCGDESVRVCAPYSDDAIIYDAEIPLLIKALQAAYDYKKGLCK